MHILNAFLIGLALSIIFRRKEFYKYIIIGLTTLRLIIFSDGSIWRLLEMGIHTLYYPIVENISRQFLFLGVWINFSVIQIVYSIIAFRDVGFVMHLIVILLYGVDNASLAQIECINAMDLTLIAFLISQNYGKKMYLYVCIVELFFLLVFSWREFSYLWVALFLMNLRNGYLIIKK